MSPFCFYLFAFWHLRVSKRVVPMTTWYKFCTFATNKSIPPSAPHPAADALSLSRRPPANQTDRFPRPNSTGLCSLCVATDTLNLVKSSTTYAEPFWKVTRVTRFHVCGSNVIWKSFIRIRIFDPFASEAKIFCSRFPALAFCSS